MIPGDLDHDPDLFEFSTVLPIAPFVENRTAAILQHYEILKTSGVQYSYFLSHQPAEPQHWHSNRFIVNSSIDKYFSISTEYQDTETGPQSLLDVKIFSTLPKFISLKEPKVKGAGKTRYVSAINCLNTSFYHQSLAYDAPESIQTLEDVDLRVNHLDNNLNVPLNTTLFKIPDEFALVWKWDSVVAHAISSTSIEVRYATDPNDVSKNPIPRRADLFIRFSRKYATATSFQSARDLLTMVIPQIWNKQGWPTQTC